MCRKRRMCCCVSKNRSCDLLRYKWHWLFCRFFRPRDSEVKRPGWSVQCFNLVPNEKSLDAPDLTDAFKSFSPSSPSALVGVSQLGPRPLLDNVHFFFPPRTAMMIYFNLQKWFSSNLVSEYLRIDDLKRSGEKKKLFLDAVLNIWTATQAKRIWPHCASQRGWVGVRLDLGRMLERHQKVKFASAQFQPFWLRRCVSAIMDDDVTKRALFNFRHSTGGHVHAPVRGRVRAHPSHLTGTDC